MKSVNCGLLLDWLTCELCFKTSEPEYFNSGLEHKIVLNACAVEIQLQKFFQISASWTALHHFVPRVRVMFCWSSEPQLSCSTSACLNETTFIITNYSCGLAAGLNSVGFSENRSAEWLHGICSVRCEMCTICLSLQIY